MFEPQSFPEPPAHRADFAHIPAHGREGPRPHALAAVNYSAVPWLRASIGRSTVQAKLTVGAVDDPLEREADRVADKITSGAIAEHSVDAAMSPLSIRRKCTACSNEEPHTEEVRRKAAGSIDGTTAPSVVDEALRSSGQPLDTGTREFMGRRLGANFANVRVHVDALADASARAIGAKAYAYGRDIFFRNGAFAPATGDGRGLLAHELVHVIQQGAAVTPSSDAASREPVRAAGDCKTCSTTIQRKDGGAPDPAPRMSDEKQKKFCGPNITKQLRDAQLKTRSHFAAWPRPRKESACKELRSLFWGPVAWDIIQLNEQGWIQNYNPPCASQGCEKSIQIDGQCFYAGSANYAHFGNMFDLCGRHYASVAPTNTDFTVNEMYKLIDQYKGKGFTGIATPSPNFKSSVDWAVAGFYNWPHGASTPTGDRPECSSACPLPYVGLPFDVNWSGENF